METKRTVRMLWCVALVVAVAPVGAWAQDGFSLNPDAPRATGPSIGAIPQRQGTSECNFIDFEGLVNFAAVGTVAGTPGVTFGASWLGLIDADAGGSGNFANEPSPDTTAFFLTPADPIDFDTGVESMEIFYVASALSVPVTLTAWDGVGGTGSVVDTATGNTVGTSFDGANCMGDPGGDFCLWDSIVLTSVTNNILSITLGGGVANQIGFDDMTYCTGALPAPALPTWAWVAMIAMLVLLGTWQMRRLMGTVNLPPVG